MMMGSKISIPEDGGIAMLDFSTNPNNVAELSKYITSLNLGTNLQNFDCVLENLPKLEELNIQNSIIGGIGINFAYNNNNLNSINLSNSTINKLYYRKQGLSIQDANGSYNYITYAFGHVFNDNLNIDFNNSNMVLNTSPYCNLIYADCRYSKPTSKIFVNMCGCNVNPLIYTTLYDGVLTIDNAENNLEEIHIKLPNVTNRDDIFRWDYITSRYSLLNSLKKIIIEAPEDVDEVGYCYTGHVINVPNCLSSYYPEYDHYINAPALKEVYLLGKFVGHQKPAGLIYLPETYGMPDTEMYDEDLEEWVETGEIQNYHQGTLYYDHNETLNVVYLPPGWTAVKI